MKVLHVIPSVSPLRGGPSTAVIDMVSSLRDLGIDASIATTNDHGSDVMDVDLNQATNFQGVPCRFFPRWSPPVRAVREFAYSGSFRRWLKANIESFDVIHIHAIFSACSSYAMWLARQRNVPYLVRTIGQLEPWSLEQSRLRKSIFLTLFEHENLRHAERLHCTSELEASHIKQFDATLRTVVVPLGVELPEQLDSNSLLQRRTVAKSELRNRFKLDEDTKLLLFLARIHPKKGLEHILKALANHASLSDCHLLIAGSGEPEYLRKIENDIDALKIKPRCHFAGFLQDQEKSTALLGSDLYVLPSSSENFGISVLEALGHGTPVIISKEVALAASIDNTSLGRVIKVDEAEAALAPALVNMLEEAAQSPESLHASAHAFVAQNFAWPELTAQLIRIYQSIRA
ncbi:MAG: glycosyltransferase [Pseudomonadota bacterium]